MSIYAIWESRFPADAAAEGLAVTEAIWCDMPGYDGYLGHELLIDADDPGHLLVISQWTTRERADATLRDYAAHPNAHAANHLVTEPRRRFVATRNQAGQATAPQRRPAPGRAARRDPAKAPDGGARGGAALGLPPE